MEINKIEIYDRLKDMEILVEKSFSIIPFPFYLSAVKVTEVNKILEQIYDCLPAELKNTECNVYNLLKQFEFTVYNSFPLLPNYLVAVRVNELEKIIDQIYATMPSAFSSMQNSRSIEGKCAEQVQPTMEMKFLIFLGQIIKQITPIIPIVGVGIIIVYIFGIDKCWSILVGIINNISKL